LFFIVLHVLGEDEDMRRISFAIAHHFVLDRSTLFKEWTVTAICVRVSSH